MDKKYDFISIDCEKANNGPFSLCSVGIAGFKKGKVVLSKEYIIRPEPFLFYAGAVVDGTYHGVPVSIYEKSPTMDRMWKKIKKIIGDNIIVGHGINGDLVSIKNALSFYGIDYDISDSNEYICTNIASFLFYPNINSHKLKSLCSYLDVDVNPHHALSDAKAAGNLFLKMFEISDCRTIKEFVQLCNDNRDNISVNYNNNMIEKYSKEIRGLLYSSENNEQIDRVYRMHLVEEVLEFYKSKNKINATVKPICCLSPIIEVFKNPDFSDYIDEISNLYPFTHDDFLYIRTGEKQYTLFFGALLNKSHLIYDFVLFLSRCSIPIPSCSYDGISYKRIIKYRQAVSLLSEYLSEKEGFSVEDIMQYVKFLYDEQSQRLKEYEYEQKYLDVISGNSEYEGYSYVVGRLGKLAGLYLGFRDVFLDKISDLKKPEIFNLRYSLFDLIIEKFNDFGPDDIQGTLTYADYKEILSKWYNENIIINK